MRFSLRSWRPRTSRAVRRASILNRFADQARAVFPAGLDRRARPRFHRCRVARRAGMTVRTGEAQPSYRLLRHRLLALVQVLPVFHRIFGGRVQRWRRGEHSHEVLRPRRLHRIGKAVPADADRYAVGDILDVMPPEWRIEQDVAGLQDELVATDVALHWETVDIQVFRGDLGAVQAGPPVDRRIHQRIVAWRNQVPLLAAVDVDEHIVGQCAVHLSLCAFPAEEQVRAETGARTLLPPQLDLAARIDTLRQPIDVQIVKQLRMIGEDGYEARVLRDVSVM